MIYERRNEENGREKEGGIEKKERMTDERRNN